MAELEQAGPRYRWVLAGTLRNLANVLVTDGRAQEAQPVLVRARELEALGAANDPTAARTARGDALLNEGDAQAEAGEFTADDG